MAILAISLSSELLAQATNPAASKAATGMLGMPAVQGHQLAFVYDNDLWLGQLGQSNTRRITSTPGREINPVFSGDGRFLAFSAAYSGQQDVYLMPAEGGAVKRLTWHPGDDLVLGFTPDHQSILFSSPRSVHTRRYRHLYTVPIDGGVPTRLPVPTAFKASLSPDGQRIAFVPAREAFHQWKNYRGGTTSRIWIMAMDDYSVVEIPKPDGGSNDTDPLWVGDDVIFRSDRGGEFNLYRYQTANGAIHALTQYDDFPVVHPASDGLNVVYERAGRLARLNLNSGVIEPLQLVANSALSLRQERLIQDEKWVQQVVASPDLNRVLVEYRGEIVSVPASKGDPRMLFPDPAAHDRNPVWSPVGDNVAWFSDASGEYELVVTAADGQSELRRYSMPGAGYYDQAVWSPDGHKIAYRDNSQSLWVFDLQAGQHQKVAQEPVYTPVNPMSYSWSSDSRWLAYTLQNKGLIRTVWVWDAQSGESHHITDGLSESAEPSFDPNGEFLYLLASTDAGPVKDWFSQASADSHTQYGLYAITLRGDGPHPLPAQSDEVQSRDGSEEPDDDAKEGESEVEVKIDFAGLADRITPIPVGSATRLNLRVGKSGDIFYLETMGQTSFDSFSGPGSIKRYSLDTRKTATLLSDVQSFELSASGEKILYQKNDHWFITEVSDELKSDDGQLALDKIVVRADPMAEWKQIFHEAWRINRDWFYDPNYHGADWDAMRDKYAQFLPELATREDLERVIQWMLSELAVGHSYQTPGEHPDENETIPVGLLGADYELSENRYRFKKIYGGLNWNTELRSPLRAAGVQVEEGDYLIAVNEQELTSESNLFRAFEHTLDRQTRIKVADNAKGKNAREFIVTPIATETRLRYLDWVESNLAYVNERTQGRVAYVHVPNTADFGHEMFKRYFYPQSHKEAIILDERYNGGGLIADYYIDILRRPYISHWTMRYGDDLISPRAAILGPKVMLADEGAGSGGDLLPWMFKKFKLGPVIGKRTWGGLVGILGFPDLMDGGRVTAPNLAFWTEAGYRVENEGVAPDIEIEQWPADVNAGRDPQLDKALEVILKALEEHPPAQPNKPDFPIRTRR